MIASARSGGVRDGASLVQPEKVTAIIAPRMVRVTHLTTMQREYSATGDTGNAVPKIRALTVRFGVPFASNQYRRGRDFPRGRPYGEDRPLPLILMPSAAGRWQAPSRRPNATSFDFVSPPRRGLTSSSKGVPLALGDQGEHLVACWSGRTVRRDGISSPHVRTLRGLSAAGSRNIPEMFFENDVREPI